MTRGESTTDVIVIGAGMAGLTAAGELTKAGVSSMVLDKGRAPGGRMATRTIGGARFDHGAQHFSARSDEFRTKVDELRTAGIVGEWYRADSRTDPSRFQEPRLIGTGGMRRIPEHIATGLHVRTSVAVEGLHRSDSGIVALAGESTLAHGSAIVLTPPVPQTLNLLATGNLLPNSGVVDQLDAVSYNPSLTVMARLDVPSGLAEGHLAGPAEDVAWMADNQHKGTSQLPAVTIQSTAEFAMAHLNSDRNHWTRDLVDQAAALIDARIVDAVGHRWLYAEPQTTFDSGAIALGSGVPIVLAGEVFAGAKVEGAFLSGRAAAKAVLEML